MLCTAHAALRDRYQRRATLLDLIIFAFSVVLVAQTFADSSVKEAINVFDVNLDIWFGILATIIFLLSIVQLLVNWKTQAAAHSRSFTLYSEVKLELSYLLDNPTIDEESAQRILARYDLAAAIGTNIPESEFLHQKQRHKVKLFISKYLDNNPGTWIPLLKLKLFLSDTFRVFFKASTD
jgi:hypothetical protein